jgi:hypothetical protein
MEVLELHDLHSPPAVVLLSRRARLTRRTKCAMVRQISITNRGADPCDSARHPGSKPSGARGASVRGVRVRPVRLAQTSRVAEIATYQGAERDMAIEGAKREKELTFYASYRSTTTRPGRGLRQEMRQVSLARRSERVLRHPRRDLGCPPPRSTSCRRELGARAALSREPARMQSPTRRLHSAAIALHRQWVTIYLHHRAGLQHNLVGMTACRGPFATCSSRNGRASSGSGPGF